MKTSLRQSLIISATALCLAIPAQAAEFINILRKVPGFVSYVAIDEGTGRRIRALRIFRDRFETLDVGDETTLLAWCRDNMANYKVPRRIKFVDALPTNAAGKVQKFALRGGQPAA
jgi:acyl-CoA synthetase (AMP-forming)/AMP-acid ligase II